MRRRQVLVALAAATGTCAGLRALPAQAQGKLYRLGWFEPTTPTSSPARREEFLKTLSGLGYAEGRNLTIDSRFGYGQPDTYAQIAREMVAGKPDCIFTAGVDTVRALKLATSTIPIVLGTIDADPVKEGLAASLARPGGNVTGLSGVAWELSGKRLQLLKEIAPKARRVDVVTDSRSPAAQAHLKELAPAARSLKVEFQVHDVTDAASVERIFRELRAARPDALFVISVGATNTHRQLIIKLANDARLPAVYSIYEAAQEGGLLVYAPDILEQYRRAANYVARIFKGEKAAELPIEQARFFTLIVNRRTAKEIGLTLPPPLVGRADRVIE